MVWPEQESIADLTGTWWVAHTKSRNEKALAWQMKRKDISYFLPMTEKVSSSKGRKIRSLLPIFPGYVFFCGQENDRVTVLQTNRVANIIPARDQEQLVRELTPIERVLKSGEKLKPHNYIEAGQRCRVTAGPLAGTEGIVEIGNQTRLVLQVDMLGQATSVEIDMDMIEIIE